jgi:nitroimidazol reductase NimA-like FMN-containing flavoprotein (pyridoxamine 5'-phosphate oxidase superfamily)
MLVHELTPEQCRDVLSRTHLARLACSRADQPYVVPISVTYDAESNCVFSFSTVGRKVQWMRDNPKVCLEIDDVEDQFHWTTVVVFGRYDEIGDSAEHRDVRHRALHLFQQRSEWWLPGGAKVGDRDHHAIVVYRIHIDSVTGRRAARERG